MKEKMKNIFKTMTKLTKEEIKELLEKAYHNNTSLEEAKEIFHKVYEK